MAKLTEEQKCWRKAERAQARADEAAKRVAVLKPKAKRLREKLRPLAVEERRTRRALYAAEHNLDWHKRDARHWAGKARDAAEEARKAARKAREETKMITAAATASLTPAAETSSERL